MKIIVSHDVDHLTVWEHSYDLVLPKFLVRAILEYGFNKISLHELIERLKCFRANKWENIAELMAFNKAHHIPATFFLGVAHGKGMCYSLKNVEPWINRIRSEGFHAGLHGVAYNSESAIQKEHRLFKEISGTDTFGIRMHYLRNDPKTLNLLAEAGYAFDATVYDQADPFRIGSMWEFPIHVMDGRVVQNKKIAGKPNFKTIQENTIRIIEQSRKSGNRYFSLLFHDRYYSEAFQVFKSWYEWVISYLQEEGYQFSNYLDAMNELQSCK
ncbi:MAG: hypothetical protein GX577_13540 [Leptolinea sp.]|jgi:peptidoglycan/xylan/chitin deacetylase (PgdA/CDA1 family)|nr:hypothetical protein [Leptolinea sp.]